MEKGVSAMRALHEPRVHGLWLLLILALCAPAGAQMAPAVQPASASTVIVPGYAIGPWTLDTTVADLAWILGARTVVLSPDVQFRKEVVVATWTSPPLVAIHGPGEDVLQAIGIAAQGYTTREHLGVGAREDQITGAYGRPSLVIQLPSRPKVLIYNTLGLAFQIAYDVASGTYGGAERVFVFRPGEAAAIWRVP